MDSSRPKRRHPLRREPRPVRRRWREYVAPGGGRPVRQFLMGLTDADRAEVASAMRTVRELGTKAARHLRGEIYEVRVFTGSAGYRILFAQEGRLSQILLSLEAFQKQTHPTPIREIDLAERRLRDWRERGLRR